MPNPAFNLVVEPPSGSAVHYLLRASRIPVGRGDDNTLVLKEDTISHRHCELRRKGASGYEIRDLGSRNGTQLNGEPLGNDFRELRDGDVLLIGLTVKARFVRVVEIRDSVQAEAAPQASGAGAQTRRLRKAPLDRQPEINPVAAAIARAARTKSDKK